ncbi:hypothetical protein HOG98_08870 [bacterium]|nr:hypothetical protein [bacterium]
MHEIIRQSEDTRFRKKQNVQTESPKIEIPKKMISLEIINKSKLEQEFYCCFTAVDQVLLSKLAPRGEFQYNNIARSNLLLKGELLDYRFSLEEIGRFSYTKEKGHHLETGTETYTDIYKLC